MGNSDFKTAAGRSNYASGVPTLPGTGMPSYGAVPRARVYPAPRTPGRGGLAGAGAWLVSFEPAVAPFREPLMGWVGSADPFGSLELRFPDKASAVAFVRSQGWTCEVSDSAPPAVRARSYADDLKRRLRSHVSPVIAGPQAYQRPLASRAEPDDGQTPDPVAEADMESFPASDPPAWTGVTIR